MTAVAPRRRPPEGPLPRGTVTADSSGIIPHQVPESTAAPGQIRRPRLQPRPARRPGSAAKGPVRAAWPAAFHRPPSGPSPVRSRARSSTLTMRDASCPMPGRGWTQRVIADLPSQQYMPTEMGRAHGAVSLSALSALEVRGRPTMAPRSVLRVAGRRLRVRSASAGRTRSAACRRTAPR